MRDFLLFAAALPIALLAAAIVNGVAYLAYRTYQQIIEDRTE